MQNHSVSHGLESKKDAENAGEYPENADSRETLDLDMGGIVNLMGGFWDRLRKDIRGETGAAREGRARIIEQAIQYLSTDDFAHWCELCGAKPEAVRESLIADIPSPWRRFL